MTYQALRLCTLAPLALLVGAACSSSTSPAPVAPEPPAAEAAPTAPQQPPEATPADPGEAASRPPLTAEECESQGGSVVGDIGDGAIHRPDYVCPSGAVPTGSITAAAGGSVAVEGAVCCPP